MKLLLLVPKIFPYSATLGNDVNVVAMASGMPRRRRHRIGATHKAKLEFSLTAEHYDYLMSFWRLTRSENFACRLFSTNSHLQWHSVQWASEPSITNHGGGVFTFACDITTASPIEQAKIVLADKSDTAKPKLNRPPPEYVDDNDKVIKPFKARVAFYATEPKPINHRRNPLTTEKWIYYLKYGRQKEYLDLHIFADGKPYNNIEKLRNSKPPELTRSGSEIYGDGDYIENYIDTAITTKFVKFDTNGRTRTAWISNFINDSDINPPQFTDTFQIVANYFSNDDFIGDNLTIPSTNKEIFKGIEKYIEERYLKYSSVTYPSSSEGITNLTSIDVIAPLDFTKINQKEFFYEFETDPFDTQGKRGNSLFVQRDVVSVKDEYNSANIGFIDFYDKFYSNPRKKSPYHKIMKYRRGLSHSKIKYNFYVMQIEFRQGDTYFDIFPDDILENFDDVYDYSGNFEGYSEYVE